MRQLLIILALATALAGCGDDDTPPANDPDDGESPRSQLERPDTLPRPPARGLPDDLRPPR